MSTLPAMPRPTLLSAGRSEHMFDHKNRILGLALVLIATTVSQAQVVSPSEIKDPRLRSLQVQYNDELTEVGRDLLVTKFDYPFYMSATLDLDQSQQQRASQRSIRFDRYQDRTVLAITGNYFAAYSEDKRKLLRGLLGRQDERRIQGAELFSQSGAAHSESSRSPFSVHSGRAGICRRDLPPCAWIGVGGRGRATRKPHGLPAPNRRYSFGRFL